MEQLFTLWQPVQFSEATLQEHRTQANTTGLYCCPECLLEIFLPPIIGTPQFYTEAYNLKGDQEISVVGYSTTKWDFEEAARDLGGLQRVLDVGCGPGNFLDIAVRTVPEVAGIESNPIAIDVARRNGHTIYMNLAESARTFYPVDAAFSFHLLEHVADPIDFSAFPTLLPP